MPSTPRRCRSRQRRTRRTEPLPEPVWSSVAAAAAPSGTSIRFGERLAHTLTRQARVSSGCPQESRVLHKNFQRSTAGRGKPEWLQWPPPADVAELVDAHGSGPCARKGVEVQVLSSASVRFARRSQSRPVVTPLRAGTPAYSA